MKNWLKVLLLAAFTMILVAGCSTKAPGSTEEPATSGENKGAPATDSMKLGLSISTLNNPFFVTLKEGAEAEAKKQGIQITTIDAQNDPAKQISDIEDLIQQGVSALIINPTDSAAVVSAIESANNAGIPVITVDRSAEGGEVVAHIASDNAAGGKMAGEFILETLGNKGKIVELEGIPGSSAARERGEGFHSAVDGVEGVEVVAKQAADFDRAKGLTVMENILQGNKDIQAVFAHNDEMALGALEALAAAGLKDVLVVGFDATEDAVKAVEDGRMGATVAQKPDLIGQKGVETAISVIKGEKVEEFIPVELELIK
ncbi:ribose ABC transporter substrate-binding protein RbsB [Schinkia azotoformans]|uniref:Periplasmic binding protein/LacI transcriptional regulator n=1 Tax=Schinkia azotoformans LMG 9581 TaxID=1131731 RepID=K6E9J8_SCHAZ|nr:ribose ABC transporter substrate-binding protein RbsB [Schinkia azotoformans]EKN70021.1 periplasmic binding protein/LacI transcriptional regulator [Schinkia azotoformans LMG 9581]MEC1641140.1 ribose ABC transporter substrate-binding protein RbsB [Schinkia azotoformans]MEC1947650.1 ribose ABC transporter substrate-binding protein RbsB [Schinkia azotoformans]